jgi:hypothetical protein
MTAAIYQCGDTIQITEQFYNFLGVLANLTAPPTVTVYGSDKLTVIGTPGTATNAGTGVYQYSLTLPLAEGIYYISFEGTAADATPTYHREAVIVKFASST